MAEIKKEEESPGQYWHSQLESAQKVFDKWETRGKKVVKRYRDDRDAIAGQKKKFNILWSNIQVLQPSLYGRAAKPEVSRRHMDQDPAGRLASTMLERVIDYEVSQFPDFDAAMNGVVEDRLLPGRGTAWVRYEPVIVPAPELDEATEPAESPAEEVAEEGAQITSDVEPSERVDSAHSPCDYVYWQDFLHSPARTWSEVWWVARWVYMTRDEGVERFGKVFKNVPLDATEPVKDFKGNAAAKASLDKKAKVAEIWDKRTGTVCWVAHGYPQELDSKEDPLKLEGFFPCPKPLYATMTNGTLIPVPDFCEYEDQAEELDSLTNRISMLVKACKAVGVFNGEYKELQRLLNEGVDNKLFPVTAWAALAEKGGLKGAVDMLDISTVLKALNELYVAREAVKQSIYEIMGISDILRGSSQASETLGAQQLKAQFGSLRLRNSQGDVARFASDLFRIKAQIICKYYPPELIVEISGVMDTDDGKDPALLQAAVQLLQNSTIRDYQIEVESDSLAQIDEQAEKQAATEVTLAVGQFIKEALPVVQAAPEMLPLVGEMLLFTVRRFRAGRSLEGAIEKAMKQLEAKAQQAAQQPPPPDPEMIKAQAQQQADQARIQADGQIAQMNAQSQQQTEAAKLQHEQQLAQYKAQLDEQKMVHEMQMKANETAQTEQFNRWKAELDAATKIMVAQISAKASLDQAMQSAEQAAAKEMQATAQQDGQASQLVDMHGQTLEALRGVMETLAKPKTIIRGADGRVAGVS